MLKDKIRDKIKNLKFIKLRVKIEKIHIAVALAALAMLVVAAFALSQGFFGAEPPEKTKPVPSVSIGCDRVIWKGTEFELSASTQNVNRPSFNWTVDGKDAGSSPKIKPKFELGEHKVMLKVTFDNKTLTAGQTTTVIDSADGISLRDSAASKNQWGFQTMYRGKNSGVKEVTVSVDSLPPSEVNACGYLTTISLMAGDHTWKAAYLGKTISSGTFNIKEVSEMKISSVEVAPSYTAGDTVNGKILLKNTGSVIVTGFDIKTVAINNNYAWMGDVAKKDYLDRYTYELKPGESYEISIRVTIPEKVSGIRPSGKYTITVSLMLNGQVMDTKVVNTEVK